MSRVMHGIGAEKFIHLRASLRQADERRILSSDAQAFAAWRNWPPVFGLAILWASYGLAVCRVRLAINPNYHSGLGQEKKGESFVDFWA